MPWETDSQPLAKTKLNSKITENQIELLARGDVSPRLSLMPKKPVFSKIQSGLTENGFSGISEADGIATIANRR